MCREAKPVRSVVLFEGQVNWIMERDSPEEKLAAWETLAAIAFPPDEEHPYVPPPIPSDGTRLSTCDRVRRDVYNLFKDVIESRAVRNNGKLKDLKKVEAGRMGATARWLGDSSASDTGASVDGTTTTMRPAAGTTKFSRYRRPLSEDDKAQIAHWDSVYPDAKALQEYFKKNYYFQNKTLICSDEFCAYLYHVLAEERRWISPRTGRPFEDIKQATHYIAIELAEREKDEQAAFKLMSSKSERQSSEDLAAIERKRRRRAEKAAAEKVLRGEL